MGDVGFWRWPPGLKSMWYLVPPIASSNGSYHIDISNKKQSYKRNNDPYNKNTETINACIQVNLCNSVIRI